MKPNESHRVSAVSAAFASLALLATLHTAHAQTTWTGSVDNDWHNENNWTNGLPGIDNRPIIENAGDVVNLTQNVTTSGGSLEVRALVGTGAPATLNIAADLDLSGQNIILGVGQADGLGWYRAMVNQTAGDVVGNAFRLAQRPNESGAASEYNLTGGSLGVATFRVGELGGTGVFTIGDATLSSNNEWFIGHSAGDGTLNIHEGAEIQTSHRVRFGFDAGSTGTINMKGGKWTTGTNFFMVIGADGGGAGILNMHPGAEMDINQTFHIGRAGTGTFNMYGGSLTGGASLNAGRNSGGNGTWNIYSGSVIETTAVIFFGREENSTGTLRTWLDGSEFIPILSTNENGLSLGEVGGTAHLDVALVGGVMLTDRNEFHLLNAGGQTGEWTSTPNATLWTTTAGGGNASVALSAADGLRGSLDASSPGNSATLDTSASAGYIEISNFNTAKQLRLDMLPASVGSSNLDDYIADLSTAGYSPIAGGNSVVISLDPQIHGADFFVWDLGAYTDNDEPLQIEAITVVIVESPRITAFSYNPADGSAVATIEGGVPDTRFKLVASATLDFANPDVDPVPLDGATVGTLIDGFYIVTDENGIATVQFNLGTGPANFVRAETTGTITIAEFDFEADGQGFTPTGDWEWGTPASDNGLTDGQVAGGNGGSTGAWATALGDGGPPVNGGITPATDSILRSPNIDLGDIGGASLQFAAAVDAVAGDTLEVLVRDAANDALLQTITPFPANFPSDAAWQNLGPYQLSQDTDDKMIYLEFRYVGNDPEYLGFYLDDVRISF